MRCFVTYGLLLSFGVSLSARAESSLAFDSALGFTTNADLVQDQPEADLIMKAGGKFRFPVADSKSYFSLRYSDYAKQSANDVLSADLGSSWFAPSSGAPTKTYRVGLSLRNYINSAAANTDQSFSHAGVTGSVAWRSSSWSGGPQIDFEIYPGGAPRSDFSISIPVVYEYSMLESESELSFSLSPKLLLSTVSDFSKFLLAFSIDYDSPVSETSDWGASITLTPSLYLSRATTTTATLLSGKKKALGSTTVTAENESLISLNPSVWWSKRFSTNWEFRLEGLLNFQTSKSNTFNYTEFKGLASIHYRVF